MKISKQTSILLVSFVLCIAVAAAGGATASKLITSKQIKNGTIGMKDLSKDVRKRIAKTGSPGAAGAQGAQGPAGPKGDAGPTLIRITRNIESTWGINATSSTVATINTDLSDAGYSGEYNGSLTHPAGVAFLAIQVQARVANVTGIDPVCRLETRKNSDSWTLRDSTGVISVSTGDAYMSSVFASFTPGDTWAFRVQCWTLSGSGTARGEIAVVAGSPGS